MASQNLNVGTAANANDGDTLRAAFIKVRKMFAEIYGQTYVDDTTEIPSVTFEIKEDKLKVNNSAVDGYVLTYDSGTGGFEWQPKFDGDITSIVAGEGLTGSSLDNGDATLNVNVDDSTLEIDTDVVQVKDGGVDTDQLADDAVDRDKLDGRYTDSATIPADYDINFESATVFTDTMDGDIDYDIENPSVGDVKTLVLTGDGTDRTITFTMSGSTDTDANIFKKMKGSDDFVFTSGALNLVQMIVVDDTANGEEIWYSNSVVAS